MIKEAIKQYQSSHGFDHFDPKCVLFDMDGVLYNSMRNHAAAWQEAMAQFDIHFTAADSYATEGARGVDTIRHFVRKQQGREIDEAEAQRMYDVKADLFHRMPTAEIFPGVLDIMQKIQSSGLANHAHLTFVCASHLQSVAHAGNSGTNNQKVVFKNHLFGIYS